MDVIPANQAGRGFVEARVPSKLHSLLQSQGGLFTAVPIAQLDKDELSITIRTTRTGDVGALWQETAKRGRSFHAVQGTGSGLSADGALIPALAEGLERYCTCVFHQEQFISATAAELGEDALDLDTIPRCSARELADAKCPLSLPDPESRIRWVRGMSILDQRIMYVPAIMVYSHIGFARPGERFWLPISTGCAAHESYPRALLRAICEVIERDAISVTWLQKLKLPEIEIDRCASHLEPYWDLYSRASSDVQYRFYNATSDLGVPTVYCLQITPYNKHKTTLVTCSTALTFESAIAKAMADAVCLGLAFRRPQNLPENPDDFADIMHGAIYMARAEQAHAFEFLRQESRRQRLSDLMKDAVEEDESTALIRILSVLDRRRLATFAVDLSSDEAIRSDMRVLRVLIPGLQPVSFRHRARYLGHRRLYEAPAQMGYPVLCEEDLNPWPQPFA